jgi:hypothetical protein
VHDIVVVTEDVGVTCDLLDSTTSEPHTTNMLCDKCKMSFMNENIVCDKSQPIVENEILVSKVKTLTHDLDKAYGGKPNWILFWEANVAHLTERLGYVPKRVRMLLQSKRPYL